MKGLKSVVVLLALLASLLGGYLVGVSAPHGPLPLPVLHQPALHQHLANTGSTSGGDPGNGWPESSHSMLLELATSPGGASTDGTGGSG